ncbi:MAG: NADH-quinone oxidoreductase subunit NuoH [Bacillota bacterium]|nr:NADH-quinone oxidoreductase subunit NuoH [Bacillota bacterium]
MPVWLSDALWALLKVVLTLAFVGLNAYVVIWGERKVAARFQRRVGPEVVGGPAGILQSLADGVKLLAKEDIRPAMADGPVWFWAPVLAMVPGVLVLLVIPYDPHLTLVRMDWSLVLAMAASAFTAISYFMAGWGSNNKYSLLGAMRGVAQLVSYEIPLILSFLGVVMITGTLDLSRIAEQQDRLWLVIPQILGFIVFYIASLAELNRVPFDLVSGESELVAGYLTEYSGIRWTLFLFGEYTNLFASSALAVTLFFGGWHGPLLPGWLWFLIKTYTLVWVAMWIRWTLPRVRIDQLMDLGWKFLTPLALINVALTGIWLAVL